MNKEQQQRFLSNNSLTSCLVNLINSNTDIFGEEIACFNIENIVFSGESTQEFNAEQQRFLDVCENMGFGLYPISQQRQDDGSAESQDYQSNKISIDVQKIFQPNVPNTLLSENDQVKRMDFFVKILNEYKDNQFVILNSDNFPRLEENDSAKKYQHALQLSLDKLTNADILCLPESIGNFNANNFELSNYLQMISARNKLMNTFQLTDICKEQSQATQSSLSDSFALQLLTKPDLLNKASYTNDMTHGYFNVFSLQPAPDKVPETMPGKDINEKKMAYIKHINSNLLSMYPLYFQKITDIIAQNPVVAKSYTGLNFSLPFKEVETENRNQVLQNSLSNLNEYFIDGENTLGNVYNFYISIDTLSTEAFTQLVDFAKKLTNKHHIVLKYNSIADNFVYSTEQDIVKIPCLLTLMGKGDREQIVSTALTNKKIDDFYAKKQDDTNVNIKNLYNALMQQRNNYAKHARLSFDQENAQEHNEIEQNLLVVSNDTGKKFTANNYISAVEVEVAFEQEQEEEQEEEQQQQQNQEQQQATSTNQENDSSTHNNDDDSDFEQIIRRDMFVSYVGSNSTPYLSLLNNSSGINFLDLKKAVDELNRCEDFWNVAISSSDNKTYAIQGVTKTAMDFILHHPELFVNGINVDNLPKGFFVFNRNNEHLLGYDVYGLRSENNTNQLTPCIEMTLPPIDYTDVMGDHRQLNSAENLEDIGNENNENRIFWNDLKSIKDIVLYRNDEKNKQIISRAMTFFKKKFLGYERFFSILNFDNLELVKQQKFSLFLFSTFIKTGEQPTKRLLNALQYMANTNATLFEVFIDTFVFCGEGIQKSGVSFLQPDCLDKMYQLANLDEISLEWWKVLSSQHTQLHGNANFSVLFDGFQYFIDEMKRLGVSLPVPCPISEIQNKNMLTTMDYILSMCQCINEKNPNLVQFQLENLYNLDLRESLYAIKNDGFSFVTQMMAIGSTKDRVVLSYEKLTQAVSDLAPDFVDNEFKSLEQSKDVLTPLLNMSRAKDTLSYSDIVVEQSTFFDCLRYVAISNEYVRQDPKLYVNFEQVLYLLNGLESMSDADEKHSIYQGSLMFKEAEIDRLNIFGTHFDFIKPCVTRLFKISCAVGDPALIYEQTKDLILDLTDNMAKLDGEVDSLKLYKSHCLYSFTSPWLLSLFEKHQIKSSFFDAKCLNTFIFTLAGEIEGITSQTLLRAEKINKDLKSIFFPGMDDIPLSPENRAICESSLQAMVLWNSHVNHIQPTRFIELRHSFEEIYIQKMQEQMQQNLDQQIQNVNENYVNNEIADDRFKQVSDSLLSMPEEVQKSVLDVFSSVDINDEGLQLKIPLQEAMNKLIKLQDNPEITDEHVVQIFEAIYDAEISQDKDISPKDFIQLKHSFERSYFQKMQEQIQQDLDQQKQALHGNIPSEIMNKLVKLLSVIKCHPEITNDNVAQICDHLLSMPEDARHNILDIFSAIDIAKMSQEEHEKLPSVDDVINVLHYIKEQNLYSSSTGMLTELKQQQVFNVQYLDYVGKINYSINAKRLTLDVSNVEEQINNLNSLLISIGYKEQFTIDFIYQSDNSIRGQISKLQLHEVQIPNEVPMIGGTKVSIANALSFVSFCPPVKQVLDTLYSSVEQIFISKLQNLQNNNPQLYDMINNIKSMPTRGSFEGFADYIINVRNYSQQMTSLANALDSLSKKWKRYCADNAKLMLTMRNHIVETRIFNRFSFEQNASILNSLVSLRVRAIPLDLVNEIYTSEYHYETNYEQLSVFLCRIIELPTFTFIQKKDLIASLKGCTDEIRNQCINIFEIIKLQNIPVSKNFYDVIVNVKPLTKTTLDAINNMLSFLEPEILSEELADEERTRIEQQNALKERLQNSLFNQLSRGGSSEVIASSIQRCLNFHPREDRFYLLQVIDMAFPTCPDQSQFLDFVESLISRLNNTSADEGFSKSLEAFLQKKPRPVYTAIQKFIATSTEQRQEFLQKYELDPFCERHGTEQEQEQGQKKLEEQYHNKDINSQIDLIKDRYNLLSLDYNTREKIYKGVLYINEIGNSKSLKVYGNQQLGDFNKPVNQLTAIQLQTLLHEYRKLINPKDQSEKKLSPQEIDIVKLQAIAILREIMYRTTGKHPYLVQMFSIINSVLIDGNIMSEIRTGEGKGLITAMQAVAEWLNGKTVDVCSSNTELARRDLEEFSSFFEYCGIKTAVIYPQSTSDVYAQDGINYSDVASLSLFQQKQELAGKSSATSSKAILLDEADWSLLDNTLQFKMSTSLRPLTDPHVNDFAPFYGVIYEFVRENLEKIKNEEGVGVKELLKYSVRSSKLTHSQKNYMVNEISHEQLFRWIGSAYGASQLRENHEFVIQPTEIIINGEVKKFNEAVVRANGRLQKGASYSNGVHQMLHARLNIEQEQRMQQQSSDGPILSYNIEPEKDSVVADSSNTFIKKYTNTEDRIIGLTGTAGSEEELQTMRQKYGFNYLVIPPNRILARTDHAPQIVTAGFFNRTEKAINRRWLSAILEQAKQSRVEGSPVLIIAEDVDKAQEIFAFLKRNGFDDTNAQQYTGIESRAEADVVEKASQSGFITVTTSILGRGTDIKLDGDLKQKGLSVITTYIDIEREHNQQIGRAGRQGDIGNSYSIFSANEFTSFGEKPEESKIATIRENKRRKNEQRGIASNYYTHIERQYFNAYSQLLQSFEQKMNAFMGQCTGDRESDSIILEQFRTSMRKHFKDLWISKFNKPLNEHWNNLQQTSKDTIEDKAKNLGQQGSKYFDDFKNEITAKIAGFTLSIPSSSENSTEENSENLESSNTFISYITSGVQSIVTQAQVNVVTDFANIETYKHLNYFDRDKALPSVDKVNTDLLVQSMHNDKVEYSQFISEAKGIIAEFGISGTSENSDQQPEQIAQALFEKYFDLERDFTLSQRQNHTIDQKAISKIERIRNYMTSLVSDVARNCTPGSQRKFKEQIKDSYNKKINEYADPSVLLKTQRKALEFMGMFEEANVPLFNEGSVSDIVTKAIDSVRQQIANYRNHTWFLPQDRISLCDGLLKKMKAIQEKEALSYEDLISMYDNIKTAKMQIVDNDEKHNRNINNSRFDKILSKVGSEIEISLSLIPKIGSTKQIFAVEVHKLQNLIEISNKIINADKKNDFSKNIRSAVGSIANLYSDDIGKNASQLISYIHLLEDTLSDYQFALRGQKNNIQLSYLLNQAINIARESVVFIEQSLLQDTKNQTSKAFYYESQALSSIAEHKNVTAEERKSMQAFYKMLEDSGVSSEYSQTISLAKGTKTINQDYLAKFFYNFTANMQKIPTYRNAQINFKNIVTEKGYNFLVFVAEITSKDSQRTKEKSIAIDLRTNKIMFINNKALGIDATQINDSLQKANDESSNMNNAEISNATIIQTMPVLTPEEISNVRPEQDHLSPEV